MKSAYIPHSNLCTSYKQAGYDPTIIVICTLPDKVHLQHNEELTANTDVNIKQPVLQLEPPELVG